MVFSYFIHLSPTWCLVCVCVFLNSCSLSIILFFKLALLNSVSQSPQMGLSLWRDLALYSIPWNKTSNAVRHLLKALQCASPPSPYPLFFLHFCQSKFSNLLVFLDSPWVPTVSWTDRSWNVANFCWHPVGRPPSVFPTLLAGITIPPCLPW